MDEKLKEKGDAYTMGFIVQKGGTEEVARRTGINRQTMRQIASGQNSPSYDSIMKLMQTYPDYDIRRSIRKPMLALPAGLDDDYTPTVETSNDDVQTVKLAVENEGLKREVKLLKDTVEILRSVIAGQMGKELGKTESVNDSTQGKQLHVDLAFQERAKTRNIPVDFRDAYGINQAWAKPNQNPTV